MVKIGASIMCANLLNLAEDIYDLDRAMIDYFHIDIMDGHFVPNLALNFDFIKQIKTITDTPIDVHLMVDNPIVYIQQLYDLKVEYVSFHISSCRYPFRLIDDLKKRGVKVGVAVNPYENIELIEYFLDRLDYILIMTVEPGFYGQEFLKPMLDKIESVKKMLLSLGLNIPIQVDGNISKKTAELCIKKGAEIFVLGTASIFKTNLNLYQQCLDFKKHIELAYKKFNIKQVG
jgi:ribulose-phosphate 3-epimerase